ncbi:MAG: SprT-like domain-containing protein [Bacteroidales bacterium]|nr:SprT-like domain-containing protein [Bacteroidales bacterium]
MEDSKILSKYLPDSLVEPAMQLIREKGIHLRISRERRTKLGDYRPPGKLPYHRISVNHNLNPYAFFLTFIHEVAHLITYEKYGNMKQPHGEEWKNNFRGLMEPFFGKGNFPDDVEKAMKNHMKNIKASGQVDLKLARVLKKYDEVHSEILLEELEIGTVFLVQEKRKFRVLEKRRTRYKCLDLNNNRMYLIHALTPVSVAE